MNTFGYFLFALMFISSCNSDNSFLVSKIINGNTLVLSNGITVHLIEVNEDKANMKILEHYLKGDILLYDGNNEDISQFPSDNISAKIYNSDGDCINQLLQGINNITVEEEPRIFNDNSNATQAIVKFEHENGILKIPILINGVKLYFIFDTGASLICISKKEAASLYSDGKLTENDFIGKSQFTDANGDISEGSILNLKNVQGNRLLNDVQACVIEGQNVPLLFGQSALQKFGKISIDYNRNEITFN